MITFAVRIALLTLGWFLRDQSITLAYKRSSAPRPCEREKKAIDPLPSPLCRRSI